MYVSSNCWLNGPYKFSNVVNVRCIHIPYVSGMYVCTTFVTFSRKVEVAIATLEYFCFISVCPHSVCVYAYVSEFCFIVFIIIWLLVINVWGFRIVMYDMKLKDCMKPTRFKRMFPFIFLPNSRFATVTSGLLKVVNVFGRIFPRDQTHWKRINRNHSMKFFRKSVIIQIGIFSRYATETCIAS